MKVWTKEEIKHLLETNDKAVCRGLVRIYELQTDDEQDSRSTSYANGVGFNAIDAEILSSFAEFYLGRGYLSPKQLKIARKKIIKYVRQLTEIANMRDSYQHVA